jgi:hypothetical protein
MLDTQPFLRRREWRFTDEAEAARFDAALAEAVRACLIKGLSEETGLSRAGGFRSVL